MRLLHSVTTITVFLLSLTLISTVDAGRWEDGEAAFSQRNYPEALRLWKPLAEQGDAKAQYNLGDLHSCRALSFKSLEPAGLCDTAESVKWYTKAAEQGHAEAQYKLGRKYSIIGSALENNIEALKWFRKAADQGHAGAQNGLGLLYANGRGVIEDDTEAVKWYRKAAEQGDDYAQYNLGNAYLMGEGVSKDYGKAAKWFRKAAEQGHSFAQYYLGLIYAYGEGIPEDDAEAFKWIRRSAEQGLGVAEYQLGLMYASGEGVQEDDVEAVKWFRKVADLGDADAQLSLGWAYASGSGVPEDDAEAAKWFRKAAEQGHADAQTALGLMYAEGKSVPQNYAEAVKWLRKAAEQGDAYAQFTLGVRYDYGEGVLEDDAEAVRWYRKAAKQGLAKAQFNLGVMYASGKGVMLSGAAAADWYYKAGISFLKSGDREEALTCVERIKKLTNVLQLTVPNSFLADKLLKRVYGQESEQASPQPKREQTNNMVSGTGWPVAGGFVVTNHHVVAGHDNIVLLRKDGEQIRATVAVYDATNDLALLKPESTKFLLPALPLSNRSAQVGEQVFTVGYPHPDMMGAEAKLTQGIVNARTGLMNDPRMYQISVPLQAGNSGGPLLNMNGEVVGVVMAKISAVKVFEWTGDLPQNVNYAVKAGYVRVLLSSVDPAANLAVLPAKKGSLTSLADRVVGSVLMVVAQ